MCQYCSMIVLGLGFASLGFAVEDPKAFASDNEKRSAAKSAQPGTDDSSLLEFFRRRTHNRVDPEQILSLVRQLGDGTFKVRERASAELVAMGMVAKPYLAQAMKLPDPEIVRRAEECLDHIQTLESRTDLTIDKVRLLAARKPAGTAEALLAFAPFAENDAVTEEIQATLAKVGADRPEVRQVLAKALTDRLAVRRSIAAEALCRTGDADAIAKVRPLLQDSEQAVRVNAAMALTLAKEKRAVPVLIDLLPKLPQAQTWQIEDILRRLAGEQTPSESLGVDERSRQKFRDAWLTWWTQNEARIDLGRLDGHKRLLGYTLVVLLNEGKVLELGLDSRPRLEISGLHFPLDVQILPGDRVLVAENETDVITERDRNGTIRWQQQVERPLMAQRLENGNTFIATPMRLLEVDRDGKGVLTIPQNGEFFMKALKLPNGEIACIKGAQDRTTCRFVRLDSTGQEIQQFPVHVRTSGGRIDVLPNGRVLVPEKDNNRVVEYDENGKIVWQAEYQQPVAAVRLPNGNTLVTSFNSDAAGRPIPSDQLVPAAELDRSGKVVWKYSGTSRVTRAFRR
jgi:hypothetical protein